MWTKRYYEHAICKLIDSSVALYSAGTKQVILADLVALEIMPTMAIVCVVEIIGAVMGATLVPLAEEARGHWTLP